MFDLERIQAYHKEYCGFGLWHDRKNVEYLQNSVGCLYEKGLISFAFVENQNTYFTIKFENKEVSRRLISIQKTLYIYYVLSTSEYRDQRK